MRDRAVFVVGDSLGEGTKPYVPGALPGWQVSQSVATSRFVPEGVSIVRSRGGLPGAVVFALGTNDDPHNVPGFRNAIETVLSIAGKTRCVVVPNIVRPAGGWGELRRLQQARSPQPRPRTARTCASPTGRAW